MSKKAIWGKLNKHLTTVCCVVGRYDEEGNYSEVIMENVKLKEFNEVVAKNIYLDRDITIQIAPRIEIRVFAKSVKDIERYIDISGRHDEVKGLFDCFSKHNDADENYIWTTVDFEELRRMRSCPPPN